MKSSLFAKPKAKNDYFGTCFSDLQRGPNTETSRLSKKTTSALGVISRGHNTLILLNVFLSYHPVLFNNLNCLINGMSACLMN